MTPNIKIKFKNLKGKSEKELLEMTYSHTLKGGVS